MARNENDGFKFKTVGGAGPAGRIVVLLEEPKTPENINAHSVRRRAFNSPEDRSEVRSLTPLYMCLLGVPSSAIDPADKESLHNVPDMHTAEEEPLFQFPRGTFTASAGDSVPLHDDPERKTPSYHW